MRIIILIISCLAYMPININANPVVVAMEKYQSHKVDYKKFPSKTIYKIVNVGNNVWSSTSKIGYYDADANRMWIDGVDYNIYENRAYGQENDVRSEYRYVAGDYYFNL